MQMKYFHLDCFLMEYIDSIKEGDGDRILRCWRYMVLLFKVSNKTKYPVEAYNLLAHYQYLFSERMCKQLLWSHLHTVNVHGKTDKNILMYLHMKHLNRDLASDLGPKYGRSISQKSRKDFKDFNRNTTSF